MAENDALGQDALIKRSEEFIYQLFKNIDHSAFHKVRSLRLGDSETVNAALVKVFAYRHTYGNFEDIRAAIGRIAQEIASRKAEAELKALESEEDDDPGGMEPHALRLIKTLIFLLHKEVDRCLEEHASDMPEPENPEPESSYEKWRVISRIAGKIAGIRKRKELGEDVPKLVKIILFLLRGEIRQYIEEKERRGGGGGDTQTDHGLDELMSRIGDKALDELIRSDPPGPEIFFPPTYEDDDDLFSEEEDDDDESENEGHETVSEEEDASQEDRGEVITEFEAPAGASEKGIFDDLLSKIGDEGLDELLYGVKPSDKPRRDDDDEEGWMGWVD